jgi:hypothetical protein
VWDSSKKSWLFLLAGLGLGAFAVALAGLRAIWVLAGLAALLYLASFAVRQVQKRKLLKTAFYLDRYWTEQEKLVLKRYAWYWQSPDASAGAARLFTLLLGACLGAGADCLFQRAFLGTVPALVASYFSALQAQVLDPVATLSTRVDRNDYSASQEWNAVREIQRQI